VKALQTPAPDVLAAWKKYDCYALFLSFCLWFFLTS
jgi:hypothetical protein